MERYTGLEPILAGWKPAALPSTLISLIGTTGFEPVRIGFQPIALPSELNPVGGLLPGLSIKSSLTMAVRTHHVALCDLLFKFDP